MKEQTVYLVMLGAYDGRGIISSSIRVFGTEELADAYKQVLADRLTNRDLYGVDYVCKVARPVAGDLPVLKENELY
jgi:hypothetical protein